MFDMNSPEIKKFIKENADLFWYIPEEKKQDISHEVLVEFILNYGEKESVKTLFKLLGIDRVAEIFYNQINRKRVNYYPQVIHFFDLYFQKYAHRDIK